MCTFYTCYSPSFSHAQSLRAPSLRSPSPSLGFEVLRKASQSKVHQVHQPFTCMDHRTHRFFPPFHGFICVHCVDDCKSIQILSHFIYINLYIIYIYISIHSFEQRPSETQTEQTSKRSSQKTIPPASGDGPSVCPQSFLRSHHHIASRSFFLYVCLSFIRRSFFLSCSFISNVFLSVFHNGLIEKRYTGKCFTTTQLPPTRLTPPFADAKRTPTRTNAEAAGSPQRGSKLGRSEGRCSAWLSAASVAWRSAVEKLVACRPHAGRWHGVGGGKRTRNTHPSEQHLKKGVQKQKIELYPITVINLQLLRPTLFLQRIAGTSTHLGNAFFNTLTNYRPRPALLPKFI